MSAVRALAHRAFDPLVARAVQVHVAGTQIEDAMCWCRALREHAMSAAVAYWNTVDEAPAQVAAATAAIARSLAAEPDLGAYVSVKLPALRYDPSAVQEVVRQADGAVPVHFDAHWPDAATPTLDMAATLGRDGHPVGVTLPGRWVRSLQDAERFGELATRVRLVKGQWADPQDPRRDPRAGTLAVLDRLAGGRAVVAVASHDPVLVSAALRRLRATGTPAELELLLGLPLARCRAIALRAGVPVRLYVPFGWPWPPYTLATLRRQPWRAALLVRDLQGGGRDLRLLRLAAGVAQGRPVTPAVANLPSLRAVVPPDSAP